MKLKSMLTLKEGMEKIEEEMMMMKVMEGKEFNAINSDII
jgi:hypothetical protein